MKYKNCKVGTKVVVKTFDEMVESSFHNKSDLTYCDSIGKIIKVLPKNCSFPVLVKLHRKTYLVSFNHKSLRKIK